MVRLILSAGVKGPTVTDPDTVTATDAGSVGTCKAAEESRKPR